MKRIVLALVLAALATPALSEVAQRRPPLTGDLIGDIKNAATQGKEGAETRTQSQIFQALAKPFQDIANFIGQDAEDAIALATAIPGLQDGNGQQCWIAARNFTAVAKAHPLPLTGGGMRDLEALRLLNISAKQLCSDSHCNQVFTDLKQAALTAAQGIAGQLGAAAVRNVPSLQDLCTLVPNVPLAEPLTPVPPAPDVKPVGSAAPDAAPK